MECGYRKGVIPTEENDLWTQSLKTRETTTVRKQLQFHCYQGAHTRKPGTKSGLEPLGFILRLPGAVVQQPLWGWGEPETITIMCKKEYHSNSCQKPAGAEVTHHLKSTLYLLSCEGLETRAETP